MSNMLINANQQRINANNRTTASLVYPELSYQLMGIFFDVQNSLGSHYQEKYYQRAIEVALNKAGIPFEREKQIEILFKGQKMGKHILDFLVDGKIAIEVKTLDFFRKKEWRQVRSYLQSANLRLGILVNFNGERLVYKRILNSHFQQ